MVHRAIARFVYYVQTLYFFLYCCFHVLDMASFRTQVKILVVVSHRILIAAQR